RPIPRSRVPVFRSRPVRVAHPVTSPPMGPMNPSLRFGGPFFPERHGYVASNRARERVIPRVESPSTFAPRLDYDALPDKCLPSSERQTPLSDRNTEATAQGDR